MSTFWDDPPPSCENSQLFFFRMNPSLSPNSELKLSTEYVDMSKPVNFHTSLSTNIPKL